jgi:alcohol dehydrogenase, propanol-preferring
MLAARMHGYKQPLVIEEVPVPEILPDQVLVRVGGAGMCRSDVQLIDGYFADALKTKFPITPGHEIAGQVAALGDGVPKSAQLAVGDQVVVAAGWGDGICRQCRLGNEQLCDHGSWPGFGPPGGYAEFVPVPYRQLIRVEHKLKWEELAPLTDAGVTPYRAIKKLRAAGVLGPDRTMGVFGASGLGSYAVQYAKLLSSGATVVAFARSDEKLAIAKERGADVVINTRGKSLSDLQAELLKLTGSPKLDAAIDCVGAEETIQTGIGLLATAGVFVSVGLVGTRIDVPLFPFTARELTYHGSFWANYADLQEVLALAEKGKIQHSIKRIRFQDVNENIELLRAGEIVGRAVITFDLEK